MRVEFRLNVEPWERDVEEGFVRHWKAWFFCVYLGRLGELALKHRRYDGLPWRELHLGRLKVSWGLDHGHDWRSE